MLIVSWTKKITNEKILNKISKRRFLWKSLIRRRNGWIGHIIRYESLLKLIIERSIEKKTHIKRPRFEYIKQIMTNQRCNSYLQLKKKRMTETNEKKTAN